MLWQNTWNLNLQDIYMDLLKIVNMELEIRTDLYLYKTSLKDLISSGLTQFKN